MGFGLISPQIDPFEALDGVEVALAPKKPALCARGAQGQPPPLHHASDDLAGNFLEFWPPSYGRGIPRLDLR